VWSGSNGTRLLRKMNTAIASGPLAYAKIARKRIPLYLQESSAVVERGCKRESECECEYCMPVGRAEPGGLHVCKRKSQCEWEHCMTVTRAEPGGLHVCKRKSQCEWEHCMTVTRAETEVLCACNSESECDCEHLMAARRARPGAQGCL
jgi:hypothetical protein